MQNIKIKLAKIDHISILQKVNDESFIANAEYDPDIVTNWAKTQAGKNYFTQLVSDPNKLCLIAFDHNLPVGYIACAPKAFSYRQSRYFEISDIGVIPEYRSKGIGKKLIEKSITYAKNRGYQKMFVNSYFKNTRAVNFYKKCGFKEIDIRLEQNIA